MFVSRRAMISLLVFGAGLLAEEASALYKPKYQTPIKAVKAGKRIRIPMRYQRRKGYCGELRIVVDGVVHGSMPEPGNRDHGGVCYADKSGYYTTAVETDFATTSVLGATHEVVLEMCYSRQGSSTSCVRSDPRTFALQADYAAELSIGDWVDRKARGPYDAGRGNLNNRYTNTSGKKVGGYYTNWSLYNNRNVLPKDIPVENLDYLYHAFLGICGGEGLNGALKDKQDANLAKGINDENVFNVLTTSCMGRADFQVSIHDKDVDINYLSGQTWINYGRPLDDSAMADDPIKGIFAEYYRMKKAFPDAKILPSIGGYTLSDPFFTLSKTAANRKVFIDSVIEFLNEYDVFDGVDIDWEYPGLSSWQKEPKLPNPPGEHLALGTAADTENFRLLLRELREALDRLEDVHGRDYELHIALGPDAARHIAQIDFRGIEPYVDRVNLMTYDYYGPWNNVLGHHAALWPYGECSYSNLNRYKPYGLGGAFTRNAAMWGSIWGYGGGSPNPTPNFPMEKLSIGYAGHGYIWKDVPADPRLHVDETSPIKYPRPIPLPTDEGDERPERYIGEDGHIRYRGVEKFLMGSPKYEFREDPSCYATQYLWSPSDKVFVTVDTPLSVGDKAHYLLDGGASGIFGWDLPAESGTLLNAVHEGLGSTPY